MWEIKTTDEYERRKKHYEKKHPRELVSVQDNLDTYLMMLNSGVKPKQAIFGFVHAEPFDVVAIDQKGGGTNLAQTRLYAYPDVTRNTLYLITLGDKKSQRNDIKVCKDFVARLAELKGDSDEGGRDVPERLSNGSGDV
jgi:hypothetical protein